MPGSGLKRAYVYANAFNNENGEAENYLRASIGLDYSFGGVAYGFIEYHLSGAGAGAPEDYLDNLAGIKKPAYTDGSVYLMGRALLCSRTHLPNHAAYLIEWCDTIERL